MRTSIRSSATKSPKQSYALTRAGRVFAFNSPAARDEFCETHGYPIYDEAMDASWVGHGDHAEPALASNPKVRYAQRQGFIESSKG